MVFFNFWRVNCFKSSSAVAPFIYTVFSVAKILGISAFFHDSSAALIIDGNIIAAVQEEDLLELNMIEVFQ